VALRDGKINVGVALGVRWLLQQQHSPLMMKGKQNDVDLAFYKPMRMVVWVGHAKMPEK
jgi:hypothetical protein